MRRLFGFGAVVALAALAGCNSISGTWKTAAGQTPGKLVFGSMTLANDGTFTADTKDGNTMKMITGYYEYTGDHLILDAGGDTRTYKADLAKDTLVLTHDQQLVVLNRVPRKDRQSGSAGATASGTTGATGTDATGAENRPQK